MEVFLLNFFFFKSVVLFSWGGRTVQDVEVFSNVLLE